VIPFQDPDLEKLYAYVRHLMAKLPRRSGPRYQFDDQVTLQYYRLQKISEGAIELKASEERPVYGPTAVGSGVARAQRIELSSLIEILNERLGTDFGAGDQLFFDSVREDAVADSELRQVAMANTLENFGYVFLRELEGYVIDRMEQNEEITARFLNEPEFQDIVARHLMKAVYEQIRAQGRAA
jgi:type I restriction enzyme R subunit